jgi:hypothetical protein
LLDFVLVKSHLFDLVVRAVSLSLCIIDHLAQLAAFLLLLFTPLLKLLHFVVQLAELLTQSFAFCLL